MSFILIGFGPFLTCCGTNLIYAIKLIKFAGVYTDTNSGLVFYFPQRCQQPFGALWLTHVGLRLLIAVGGT